MKRNEFNHRVNSTIGCMQPGCDHQQISVDSGRNGMGAILDGGGEASGSRGGIAERIPALGTARRLWTGWIRATLRLALVLACGLPISDPGLARTGSEPPPARPTEVAWLKAYDVLERHCARCHQAGALQQRAKPAANLANIVRLDEVARDPHLVRPGNPDASRLYTLMLGRRMPDDVFQEGAGREAPSVDDMDSLRTWIAGLAPRGRGQVCAGRPLISNDIQQIAIARDQETVGQAKAQGVRYLTLASLWNACESEAYLEAARRATTVLLSTLTRREWPVGARRIDAAGAILAVDLDELEWQAGEWDRLAGLSPYAIGQGPDAGSPADPLSAAMPNAKTFRQPVRVDWLAFAVSEEVRKRATLSTATSGGAQVVLQALTARAAGLGAKRATEPAAFRATLAQAGLDAAPTFDQVEMLDALASRYTRDIGPDQAAAELGLEAGTLESRLEAGPPEARRLRSNLAQGGVSRAAFESVFDAVTAHLLDRKTAGQHDMLGMATIGRPPGRVALPFAIEMTAAKQRFSLNDEASLVVQSEIDCHLTLVSIAPSGRAVVLLPNDWDRNTFLPAGKEQRFPREDSPFRLRLDTPGWETIVAGCNPSTPVFDGIQHDFNLEKFTSLGDYRRFLMRSAEGMPMLTPPTAPGEKGAPRRRLPPRSGAKADALPSKPDPAARTAIRFEVR